MQIQTNNFAHGFSTGFSWGYPTYDNSGTRAMVLNVIYEVVILFLYFF